MSYSGGTSSTNSMLFFGILFCNMGFLLIMSIPMVIVGIVFSIIDDLSFLIMAIMGSIFLAISATIEYLMLMNVIKPYFAVKKLIDSSSYEKMFELLEISPMKFKDRIAAENVLNNLQKTQPEKLAEYLFNHPEIFAKMNYNSITQNNFLSRLASILGFRTIDDMYAQFEKGDSKIPKEAAASSNEEKISIVKVHFLEKVPTAEKSMISGLILDFSMDEILACPFCGRMAEKNLLKDWLKDTPYCPVCKKNVEITDCPVVKINK